MEASDREDSFLTVAEVAEKLKLNQQTVRNWIDQGALPALRVGRRVRIRRSDFDRLVEENYSGAAAAAPNSQATPNAEDFWGGEPVGLPDTRGREGRDTDFGDEGGSAEHLNPDAVRNHELLQNGSAEHQAVESEGG